MTDTEAVQPDLTDLLAAGGMTRPGADEEVPRYSGSLDPAGVERIGHELARRLRDGGVDVVLIWEQPEDLVLAHVVAREIGATVARAWDADGLVQHAGELTPGSQVVLLADAFRDDAVLRALFALAEQRGARVVGVAALMSTPAAERARELAPLACLVPAPTLADKS